LRPFAIDQLGSVSVLDLTVERFQSWDIPGKITKKRAPKSVADFEQERDALIRALEE
jgi:hypothetical protein